MTDTKITDLGDGGAVQPGDEFVVARSGSNNKISGSHVASSALLTVVKYAPSSLATYNVTSATLTALDTTNLTASFTVPDSGKVLVTFSACMAAPASNNLGFSLLNHSGGAQLGDTLSNVQSIDANARRMTIEWLLTGLTPGATLGIDIAAGRATTGTANVYAQTQTGNVTSGGVGPALIIVQAA